MKTFTSLVKNYYFVLFILIIFNSKNINCYDICDFIKIYDQIILPKEFVIDFPYNELLINVGNNKIYVLYNKRFINDDGVNFLLLYSEENNKGCVDTLFYDKEVEISPYSIRNFKIDSNVIYLFESFQCQIFKKEEKNFYFKKYKKILFNYNTFHKVKNGYLYFSNINYPPPYLDTASVFIAVYDNKLNFVKSYMFDEKPSAKYFTYFQPKKLIDISDKYIAIADIDKYKIFFYTKNFILIDSISHRPENWINGDNNYYKKVKKIKEKYKRNSKNIIDELRKEYYNISTINEIYLIDDNTLLVNWKQKRVENDYIRFFDIWIRDDKKWNLYQENLRDCINSKNDVIFTNTKFRFGNLCYHKSEYFYEITTIPFYLFNKNITFGKLTEMNNEYYIKETDTRSSILIYKFKIK